MLYRKEATPYFVALIQHSILGDFLIGGGIQLLWPATIEWYGVGIRMATLAGIFIEWTLFLASLTIMLKTKDAWVLFQHHPSNLLLSIPISTVILPTLLSFPLSVPLGLIIPHLVYLTIFTFSILMDLKAILKKNLKDNAPHTYKFYLISLNSMDWLFCRKTKRNPTTGDNECKK